MRSQEILTLKQKKVHVLSAKTLQVYAFAALNAASHPMHALAAQYAETQVVNVSRLNTEVSGRERSDLSREPIC